MLLKDTPAGSASARVTTSSYIVRSALRPNGVSTFCSDRSIPLAARRSPRVSAPSDCSLRATAAAKRLSPPTSVVTSLYIGADVWLLRCERPSCWMALSALQGSSMVMCTRRRPLPAPRTACSEMPVDAASLMMATSFLPAMNRSFSCKRASCCNVVF